MVELQEENKELTTKERLYDVVRINETVRTRKGMKAFMNYLEESGFFTSPASTKFHGAFKGGLLEHSWNLFCEFGDTMMLKGLTTTDFGWDSIFICAIGHDVCKTGQYKGEHKPFGYNKEHPKGHAVRSCEILSKFFDLTLTEIEVISFHMGVYATQEFKAYNPYINAEYELKQLTNMFNKNKLAKLFHYCDDMVSQFVDK